MNKSIPILAIFILFSYGALQAQTQYNLAGYKLPNLERRLLEAGFSFTGSNYSSTAPGINNTEFKYGNKNLEGDLDLFYQYFLNNERVQRHAEVFAAIDGGASSYSSAGETHTRFRIFEPVVDVNLVNRYYFRERNFIETHLLLNLGTTWQKNIHTLTDVSAVRNRRNMRVLLPLRYGWGRIEQVQDARHAVYIVDDLSRAGRLQQRLSENEVTELARLISRVKNERFFDQRIKRKAELQSVDSFLVARNLISEYDAVYFTSLTDIWDYGDGPVRNSGTRISAVIAPGYYLGHLKNPNIQPGQEEYFNELKYFVLAGGIEFIRERPVSLVWQSTLVAHAYGGLNTGTQSTQVADQKLNIPYMQILLRHGLGYYPNTRTEALLNLGVKYVQFFDNDDEEVYGLNGTGITAQMGLHAYYYLSPRFRLFARTVTDYLWQDNPVTHAEHTFLDHFYHQVAFSPLKTGFNFYIHGGLLYKIF
jgi:hypothetical protein